jgi:bifunctional UDP-N-acetylglucosamine pyrophosphorylase/glucosamine-1-phosphate N-acetyltransferase
MAKTTAIILAAGKGTRMKSALPKVMHAICGRPLVHYPVRAALEAGCSDVVVVVGHGREHVTSYLGRAFGPNVRTAVQETQNGTGDAARAGLAAVSPDAERLLIFYGDVPLLEASDVAKVLAVDAPFALATCVVDDATGYGRILRDANGAVVEIREHKDLKTDAERAVREINPGIFASSRAFFAEALAGLKPINAQGELYLTDVVTAARAKGIGIATVDSRGEVLVGINDRAQLAEAEAILQRRIVNRWRREGVTVREGARIEDSVVIEADATIETAAVLRGETRVAAGAVIDVGAVLNDASVGPGTHVKPYSVLDRSRVGAKAQIGPFSHLRPESELADEVHVGNFVETKKTRMAKGSKANHLAYLGDGIVGERVNVGAGTIFCNYDGFLKHTTTIEDDAFIGSDSQLVAPVTIGRGAYVATGTTVTRSVPADALAISRVKQENKEGYAGKLRARMKAAKEAAKKA